MSRYHDVTLSLPQAWSVLALTIGCEVVATLLLKTSEGLTRPLASAGAVAGFLSTMVLLAKVLEVIPTSIAYTVWTGVGTAMIAVLGVALFAEALSLRAVAGIALVVVGVAILNVSRPDPLASSV